VRLLDTGEFIWGQEKNQAKHNWPTRMKE
jgi:hypothetical protein